MGRLAALLTGSIVFSVVVMPPAAAAQRWEAPATEPSEEDLEAARVLYEEGGLALEAARLERSLELFERSYRLSGASSALFGIGYALRELGRPLESRDAFDQLLREHDDLDDEFRLRAERFRDETAARVAVLELRGMPGAGTPRIALDGSPVEDDGRRPLEIEVDPGEHDLRVAADGFSSFAWRDVVGEGRRVPIDVELVEASSSILESAWLWTGVGAAVVLTAVVVSIAVLSGGQLDHREGTIPVEL